MLNILLKNETFRLNCYTGTQLVSPFKTEQTLHNPSYSLHWIIDIPMLLLLCAVRFHLIIEMSCTTA